MSAAVVYAPRRVRVETDRTGRPTAVGGVAVEAIREQWLVEDRWWTARPIARAYFELALADGRCQIVFAERGRWFTQRA